MPDLMTVPLSSLRFDGGTQIRCLIEKDYRAELRDLFLTPEGPRWPVGMPPGVGFLDDTANCWVADGFHRYGGAEDAGLKEVPILVYEGTRRDAILYACGANERHGKRLTDEDRKRAVHTLLSDPEWSQLSVNRIAEICNLSWNKAERIVSKVRGKTPTVTRTTADGKTHTMRTENIGKRPTSPVGEVKARLAPSAPIAEEPASERKGSPVEEQSSPAPVIRDCLGILCESEDEAAVFGGLMALTRLEIAIKDAIRQVQEAAAKPAAALYRSRHLKCERGGNGEDRFRSPDLANALKELEHWWPYTVACPHCHGKGIDNHKDCKVCYGLPFVTRSAFERAPEEMRNAVLALAQS